MSFTSYAFAVFFVAVLVVHFSPLPLRPRKLVLLLASLMFYGAWRIEYVGLLLLSTVMDWFFAKGIHRQPEPGRRKVLLILSLVANLGMLCVFKYADFLVTDVLGEAVQLMGFGWTPPRFDLVLPAGISFYTFQTLSYTIDVYRGTLAPARSFLDYALYVAYFPQLVAGPIVRAAEFLPQLVELKRPTLREVGLGVALLLLGLWQKRVLADAIMSPVVEEAFRTVGHNSMLMTWVGAGAFTCQVLFDFAGYSSCAIGMAMCMGFRLPVNFHWPLSSVGFSELWRRWHISLGTWLRDYLYVPLAGKDRRSARVLFAAFATMVLGGLWHGARWNFVLWGAMHGVLLALQHLVSRTGVAASLPAALRDLLGWAAMLAGFLVSLMVFRTQSVPEAVTMVQEAFGFGDAVWNVSPERVVRIALVIIVFAVTLILGWRLKHVSTEAVLERLHPVVLGAIMTFVVFTLLTMAGPDRAFFYFQF